MQIAACLSLRAISACLTLRVVKHHMQTLAVAERLVNSGSRVLDELPIETGRPRATLPGLKAS